MDITILDESPPGLGDLLSARLYEFNKQATGITDGMELAAVVRDAQDEIIAAINGHTWGGCCEVTQLWVRQDYRSQGLGRRLMAAAELEARRRGAVQIVLNTHSFQAPGFYEKLGFEALGAFPNYPRGYEQIFMMKRLH